MVMAGRSNDLNWTRQLQHCEDNEKVTIIKDRREGIEGTPSIFDEILTSWRKIETMPESWKDKFKEDNYLLFIEGVKTMKDPKLKLTAEITAQMAGDRHENWYVLLQMGD
jgi:hypothetical protein